MTTHLLLVTIGPVQEFIAQARRTRDIWFGSHLLSELSRAAARAIASADGRLIFPAFAAGDPGPEPADQPLDAAGQPVTAVANKVLALVHDPEAIATAARAAVHERWTGLAEDVRRRCAGLLAPDAEACWREQVETLVEFLAAWAPLTGDYKEARQAVEEALAGRKLLRDFVPWRAQRGGVPKSSLDGARETVLAPPDRRAPGLVARYRIGDGEQLDAVGLIKRAGGEPEQFVPISNVAFAAWLEAAQERAPKGVEALRSQCQEVGIRPVHRTGLRWVERFPYDADVLLEDRWPVLWRERDGEAGADAAATARAWGQEYVGPLHKALGGAPVPYVACLVADGDRVGVALDAMGSADEHREFSQRLGEFATAAREIVQQRRGLLVYAGGDDVLAFVGLEDALECAQALRARFAEVMAKAAPEGLRPTLSVGLGIGHVLDGMGHLLELGRAAERIAKAATRPGAGDERDGLGVVLDKRSGETVAWRSRWSAAPVERLRRDSDLFADDELSTKKVYELRDAVRSLAECSDPEVLAAEALRILKRTRARNATLDLELLGLELGGGEAQEVRHEVERWVARLLIARFLRRACVASAPRATGTSEERDA